ncbi:hypothetical protein WOLCODRAFT_26570 [Wolfiporia cocos MD-104 SS10]|uniref:Uncharacterized protein n=1 Tax=Wolfiporia cocos (strain MD-104) TaxID=742152 RepID=A0A2H3JRW4_WOLCO|nr:hypothetical protein WOLCODRAFT_26570 [Wolfiporia cocos MD-104 SS10]
MSQFLAYYPCQEPLVKSSQLSTRYLDYAAVGIHCLSRTERATCKWYEAPGFIAVPTSSRGSYESENGLLALEFPYHLHGVFEQFLSRITQNQDYLQTADSERVLTS